MRNDKLDFLQLSKTIPARITAAEAAWLLGFAEHDIPVLTKAGLLKPLGHPAKNGTKYFAAIEVEQLRADVKWLSRASSATVRHWQAKNEKRLGEKVLPATAA